MHELKVKWLQHYSLQSIFLLFWVLHATFTEYATRRNRRTFFFCLFTEFDCNVFCSPVLL